MSQKIPMQKKALFDICMIEQINIQMDGWMDDNKDGENQGSMNS